MELEQVLHMNGGQGDTSYAKNSAIQNNIASSTKAVRQAAITEFYSKFLPECVSIADLGCSSGPNSLMVASDIVEAVEEKCRQLDRQSPEFQLLLNDLPANDFNTIFSWIPDFYRQHGVSRGSESKGCFISGVPGSFYGRLFPSRSLHFVHSSSSLHWLSQVPPNLEDGENRPLNKGNVYISRTSPPSVLDAYFTQFQRDFSLFLKCRAEEIVAGGRMVLTLMGRKNSDPSTEEDCYQLDLLAKALMDMASLGLVDEEKIDTFNFPYYPPSPEDVKNEIERQGCYDIALLETFEARWDHSAQDDSSAEVMAKGMRAVVESMVGSHFGQEIIEELFERYQRLLESYCSKNRGQLTNLVISLVRKP